MNSKQRERKYIFLFAVVFELILLQLEDFKIVVEKPKPHRMFEEKRKIRIECIFCLSFDPVLEVLRHQR